MGYRIGSGRCCHRQGAGGSPIWGGIRTVRQQTACRDGPGTEQKQHGFEVWENKHQIKCYLTLFTKLCFKQANDLPFELP